jgi:cell division protein FtsI (penicillin-binding protein 3)
MQLRGVKSFATPTRAFGVAERAWNHRPCRRGQFCRWTDLELSLDSILRGVPGAAIIVRDSKGQSRESPTEPGTPPTKGNSVVLTINADLQEIAEKALADAVSRMDAEGGDIVILDPHNGEILAMASRRLGLRETAATALTEPFEPGSTAKPFMAAGLIERRLVSDADSVDTGNGEYETNGRVIHTASHRARRWPASFAGRATSIVPLASDCRAVAAVRNVRTPGSDATGVPYPTGRRAHAAPVVEAVGQLAGDGL